MQLSLAKATGAWGLLTCYKAIFKVQAATLQVNYHQPLTDSKDLFSNGSTTTKP